MSANTTTDVLGSFGGVRTSKEKGETLATQVRAITQGKRKIQENAVSPVKADAVLGERFPHVYACCRTSH